VKDHLQRALEWLGFTPTVREAYLRRQLRQESAAVADYRQQVQRMEKLLHFRESLGAATIDTDSIRQALYGWREDR
jgi:hypothetical protein